MLTSHLNTARSIIQSNFTPFLPTAQYQRCIQSITLFSSFHSLFCYNSIDLSIITAHTFSYWIFATKLIADIHVSASECLAFMYGHALCMQSFFQIQWSHTHTIKNWLQIIIYPNRKTYKKRENLHTIFQTVFLSCCRSLRLVAAIVIFVAQTLRMLRFDAMR